MCLWNMGLGSAVAIRALLEGAIWIVRSSPGLSIVWGRKMECGCHNMHHQEYMKGMLCGAQPHCVGMLHGAQRHCVVHSRAAEACIVCWSPPAMLDCQ